MTKEERRVLFETDVEYRKQVVRELEHNGIITKMNSKEFGSLVY